MHHGLRQEAEQAVQSFRLALLGFAVPLAAQSSFAGFVRILQPELRSKIVDVPRLEDLFAVWDL